MTTEPASPARLYVLDWLRIAAFGLLVLYHVGMYYVSWDWHVKSPAAGPLIEPLMRLSSPWRLALLFFVSGAATSLMLAARGGRSGFAAARSRRLLLPLLFGMAVIVPPQAYFEVVQRHGYEGGYLDFLGLYFSAYGGFCRSAGACLVLPTWNHLWFVAYLWVYTMALWALLRLRPDALDRLARGAARLLGGPGLVLWPIALLAPARVLLAGRFPSTHALLDDWHNHAQFFFVFLAGAVLVRLPGVWPRFERLRWGALAGALAGWALITLVLAQHGGATAAALPEALRQAMRVVYAGLQWCAVVAALGFGWRHLNRDHAWRRYLVDAVFPVYILHQTLIVLLTQALAPLRWPPALEGPVLVAATFVLSFAGYEAVRRITLLRPCFGLAPTPAAGRLVIQAGAPRGGAGGPS